MPLRILNWNIRQLSAAKMNIQGMRTAIARTIVSLNPDVVILLEVRSLGAAVVMQQLSTALNVLGGGTAYTTWHLSQVTGSEYYAFLVRDTATVRPMACVATRLCPRRPWGLRRSGRPQPGERSARHHLDHMAEQRRLGRRRPCRPPYQAPAAPLVDTFVTPPHTRATKKQKTGFAGRSSAEGGYALGRGFRLPCLAIFHQHTGAGDSYFPIVVFHYAAVRGGRNHLGQSQVGQLQMLHIAQLFSWVDQQAPVAALRGYLDLDGAAQTVQEIIYTGRLQHRLPREPGWRQHARAN